MEQIEVCMLGGFSIRWADRVIRDSGRSKKVWQLLAYLICHRGKTVSSQKLIRIFWDGESSNPENALRITFHRVRSQLDQLYPGAGKQLILYRDAGYIWNDQINITVDYERFESLCTRNADTPRQRLDNLLEALELYKGDFLEKQASDFWVIPVNTHYHNLFLSASLEAAQQLGQLGEHDRAAQICRRAIRFDPYHEELHQLLIRELAADGKEEAAQKIYSQFSKRLFDHFGVAPSNQTKDAYRSAVHSPRIESVTMDTVIEEIQEHEQIDGPMQLDYDYFKVLCQVECRSIERYGRSTHVALLSVNPADNIALPRQIVSRIMELLGQQLQIHLHRGDIFSRCSESQYILMLPKVNYEDSCTLCRQIIAGFDKAHPHLAVRVHYLVQPLCPTTQVP